MTKQTRTTRPPRPKVASDHFMWHHRVHEEWGKERLQFCRFAFYPIYDRPSILKALQKALRELGVLSYTLYEITGYHDILMRVWIPTAVSHQHFETTLRQHLEPRKLNAYDTFDVSQIIAHWVWETRDAPEMRNPEPESLKQRLPDSIVRAINSGTVSGDTLASLSHAGLVARRTPRAGIKFVVVVLPPTQMTLDARDALQQKLWKLLREDKSLFQVSLYAGTGFAQYLLTGKATFRHFGTFGIKVIDAINRVGLQEYFGVRTYTHIVLSPGSDYLHFQEALPLASQVLEAEDRPIEEDLQAGESATLEVKGSAFADVSAWIYKHDGKHIDRSDKIARDGVLRTMVGMLNASGGKIILGALEAGHFTAEKARAVLHDTPRHANWLIVGIGIDYGNADWDKFQLRLQDTIKDSIIPSPVAWFTVKRLQLLTRDLCVITVHQPLKDWFYLKDDPRFHVREGNRTRHLEGPEADRYKRANSR